MIPDHLRIRPGQERLTPAQEAEARRFAAERIAAQLSTDPVDEQEAEAFLRQAYQVAGLAAPQRIHWLDGPLQLVASLAPPSARGHVGASVEAGVEDSVRASVFNSVRHRVADSVRHCAAYNVWHNVGVRLRTSVRHCAAYNVWHNVGASVGAGAADCLWDRIRADLWVSDWDNAPDSVVDSAVDVYHSVWDSVWDSVRAYENADWLAFFHFFTVYLAPNELQALAQLNELVSGYWLGQEVALLVRRPKALALDTEGRLHSAAGRAIEYQDGWGCYAWHGTRVPEKVILAPETLTRQDFLDEREVEVRRVIQERMGSRFVTELHGKVIDTGPRGTLYEVRLPQDDQERVAHYVQVQDVSTPRQYFLRVPPTIQTAAEAVAWGFRVGVEDYHPAQET